MTYIVYVTSGEHSDFRVDDIYIGSVEPMAILDAMVVRESGGDWPSWRAMKEDCRVHHAMERERRKIQQGAIAELERHGFTKANAVEVHIGD